MLWSSLVFAIDWRKYLCKTSKITCRHASNQQTWNTTYRNIQYCYLLWSRKKVRSIEITLEWNDSFNIWFRDTLHFILSDKIILWKVWTQESFQEVEFDRPGERSVQYRKWSPTANDPQNGPQMILDRKWSPKSTANDPEKKIGMTWTQVSRSSCRFYCYYNKSD